MQVNLNALTHRKARLRNGLDCQINTVLLHSTQDKKPIYKVSLVTTTGKSYCTFYYQYGFCLNPNTSDLDIMFVIPNSLKRKG
jgi:hypothetical protein